MLRITAFPFSKVIITDKQVTDKEISSDFIIYELPIFIKNIIIEYNDIKVIHLCEDRQEKTSWGTHFFLYKDELLGLFEIVTGPLVYTKIGRHYCFVTIKDKDIKSTSHLSDNELAYLPPQI